MFYVTAGVLIIINKVEGGIVAILAIAVNSIFHANPLILGDPVEQKQSWTVLVKHLAIIGGALFVLTRGKLRTEN